MTTLNIKTIRMANINRWKGHGIKRLGDSHRTKNRTNDGLNLILKVVDRRKLVVGVVGRAKTEILKK